MKSKLGFGSVMFPIANAFYIYEFVLRISPGMIEELLRASLSLTASQVGILVVFIAVIMVIIFKPIDNKIAEAEYWRHFKVLFKNRNIWLNRLVGCSLYYPTAALGDLWEKAYLMQALLLKRCNA